MKLTTKFKKDHLLVFATLPEELDVLEFIDNHTFLIKEDKLCEFDGMGLKITKKNFRKFFEKLKNLSEDKEDCDPNGFGILNYFDFDPFKIEIWLLNK